MSKTINPCGSCLRPPDVKGNGKVLNKQKDLAHICSQISWKEVDWLLKQNLLWINWTCFVLRDGSVNTKEWDKEWGFFKNKNTCGAATNVAREKKVFLVFYNWQIEEGTRMLSIHRLMKKLFCVHKSGHEPFHFPFLIARFGFESWSWNLCA